MALPLFAVSREFDPRRIATPAQWFDCADASTMYDATTGGSLVAADGTVARIEDKSGNGRHATNSTLNNRPLRKSGVVAGLDTLLFSGNGQALVSSTFSVPQPLTLVLVARQNSITAGFRVVTDGTPNRISLSNNNGALVARDANATDTSVASQWVVDVPLVVTWIVNGASSRLRVNAVQRATANASAGDHTTTILGATSAAGAFGFAGHLCEYLVYPIALSSPQAEYVERGLMGKWRVT